MKNTLQQIEDFDVLSADGQRIHVRATVTLDPLHEMPRTTYAGVLGRGIVRPVTPLGGNRFKIGNKEFRRVA